MGKYSHISKNLTRKEIKRFNEVNSIHPRQQTPREKYDFYLLLGKRYLGNSTRKTNKYTRTQKKFYREQGEYAIKRADNLRKKYGLKTINKP
jgi:hypothetical protein